MSAFVPLGRLAQIPMGEGRAFDVAHLKLAVFHTRTGKVYATQAQCPHRNGPLADGLLGGSRVTCPLHERTFDLESGRQVAGECVVRVFPVRCDELGELSVDLG